MFYSTQLLEREIQYVKIDGPDADHSIDRVGGHRPDGSIWYLPLEKAVIAARQAKVKFYTCVAGRRAEVDPQGGLMTLGWLKTRPDGLSANNLSKLPPFPLLPPAALLEI